MIFEIIVLMKLKRKLQYKDEVKEKLIKLCDNYDSASEKLGCQNELKAMDAELLKSIIQNTSTEQVCSSFCEIKSKGNTYGKFLRFYSFGRQITYFLLFFFKLYSR